MPAINKPSIIVVTAANSAYYDLALNLIASLRRNAEEIPVGILDVGLDPEQITSLESQNIRVVAPRWDFGGEQRCDRKFLAFFSRPFLPNYFPDHDVIAYVDADAWVQIPSAITELAEEAMKADVVAAPDMHVSFMHLYSSKSPLRAFLKQTYETVFGENSLGDKITINSGIFAAARDSILWRSWQFVLTKQVHERLRNLGSDPNIVLSMDRPVDFFLEANSFNHAFHTGLVGVRPVSPLYNWICEFAMPLYDPSTGLLTEPTAPFAPIQIVHLCKAGREAEFLFDKHGNKHDIRPARCPASPPVASAG
jgi:hypothetical protein